MTIKTFQAAKQICALSDWRVTNLKLQKILYLAHMVYMGRNGGEPLVDELFEAWAYGPVLPNLYRKVKIFGSQPICDVFSDVPAIEGKDEGKFLNDVCDHYLHKRAGELVAITHKDNGAWASNYEPFIRGNLISNEDILREYQMLVGSNHNESPNATQ